MTCAETRERLNAYVDGELDLVHSLEIEEHLQGCAACTQAYQNQRTLGAAIVPSSLYFAAPLGLQKRIEHSVRQATHAPSAPRVLPWRMLSLAAALAALVLLVGIASSRSWFAPSSGDLLAQEVLTGHVRSLMPGHLTDVVSSDQHTVKPWFNGRVDFSPQVEDFASQGFPLTGGRLDYLDNRPVAALVYGRQKHVINLFVWPAPQSPDSATQLETRQGYNMFHWTQAGMTYWAVSDLNSAELQQFVQLVRNGAK